MVPVSIITTSLFWMENAGGYFSVHPLPRPPRSGRLKSSKQRQFGSGTENYWAFAVPPPGAGLDTVTCIVPVAARSALASAAVSCVAEAKVVGRSVPFHCTTEAGTNPLPLTVSVNPGEPAAADAGVSPVVVGAGLTPPPPSKLVPVKLSYV